MPGVLPIRERQARQARQGFRHQCLGNVLGDLVRDGVFPDPYVESNSLAYRELEYGDFVYETEFVTPDFLSGERVILLFGGVDSIAEYYMDGEWIRADLKCTFF